MSSGIPRGSAVGLALLLVLTGGCGDDSAAAPGGVSTGPSGSMDRQDGGPTGRKPASERPPDGPILPPAEAELVVELDGDSAVYRIEVEADLGALDVHFSIDTSASIGAEIDQLQDDLADVVITQLRERVPDVSFGVSRFEDFPDAPFGSPGAEGGVPADTPFALLSRLTSDIELISNAVALLDRPLGFGGDNPESGAEALYQIATGEGYRNRGTQVIEEFDADAPPPEGGGMIGGVGFRAGALHVVMHVTDAPSHEPDDYGSRFPNTHSMEEAAEALSLIDARVIGIVSGLCPEEDADAAADGPKPADPGADADDEGSAAGADEAIDYKPAAGCRGVEPDDELYRSARTQLAELALATGAYGPEQRGGCPHGLEGARVPVMDGSCPYVFDVAADGSGLPTTVVESVITLVNGVRFDSVAAHGSDDPLGFIEAILPVEVEQTADLDAPLIVDRLPEDAPDGVAESFVDVHAKARLGFDVYLRNQRIAPTDTDQHFRVVVTVMGDELIIAQPALRVVIPAGAPSPPAALRIDAGRANPDEDAGSP